MAQAAERVQHADLMVLHCKAALALDPPPGVAARLHRALMSLHARNQDLGGARAEAEALCALPGDAFPPAERVVHHWLLARLHERSGQRAKAVRVLRDVITSHDARDTDVARLQLQSLMERAIDADMLE
jgi:hypothetical protein